MHICNPAALVFSRAIIRPQAVIDNVMSFLVVAIERASRDQDRDRQPTPSSVST